MDGYLGLSQRCDSRQDKENNGLFWHKRGRVLNKQVRSGCLRLVPSSDSG